MTGGPLLTTITAIYFSTIRKEDSLQIHFTNIARKYENVRLWMMYVHFLSIVLNEFYFILPCSSKLISWTSVTVLSTANCHGQSRLFTPNLSSFTHFLYQPFLAFQPFRSFTYSLFAKPLQIPWFRSPPVFYPHLLSWRYAYSIPL